MGEEQLTGVYRSHTGEIISFLTSEGRVISYRKALAEAEEGLITGMSFRTEPSHTSEFESSSVESLPEIQ